MANKKKNANPAKRAAEAPSFVSESGRPALAVEKAYLETGRALGDAEESQMFGKPCFKVNGKAFMSLFDNCVVFKLTGTAHEEALKLKGSKLFDPSGKGRAMKEWVQVSTAHKGKYAELAKAAMKYVESM